MWGWGAPLSSFALVLISPLNLLLPLYAESGLSLFSGPAVTW